MLFRCTLALAASVAVMAHDPRAVPAAAVPGYTDCSRMDARDPMFEAKPDCVIPPAPAGSITISCVGDSITAGGWPQIMQTNLSMYATRDPPNHYPTPHSPPHTD